jgi:hypothetical protein
MSRSLTYLLLALATVLAFGCCTQETWIADSPAQQKGFHAASHTITNQVPDMIEEVDVEATAKPIVDISPVVIALITPYAPTYIPATTECVVPCQCPVFIVQHKLVI